jgi:DNA-directed RNA polymerase specialized sigma subunit
MATAAGRAQGLGKSSDGGHRAKLSLVPLRTEGTPVVPEVSSEKPPDSPRVQLPDECGLVRSYLPLVKAIARKFYAKNKDFVDLDDLIGAGSEGLVVAARHFDPALGCRFATYASWWIRNRISRQIRDDRWVMRIPDRTYRKLLKLWKVTAILRDQTRRDPTAREVALAMDEPL